MGRVTVVGGARATAPVADLILSNIAEGSIVKLNENGTPVEFYVAKHNYESNLNGAGRTLLVRKAVRVIDAWNTALYNTYASSTIDTWFNGTYKDLLDSSVKTAISTTKFYYTIGNENATITTMSRAVFALSMAELGGSYANTNIEGTTLSIASVLKVASDSNGNATKQWTRTPTNPSGSMVHVAILYEDGVTNSNMAKNQGGYRPCFTLPSTAKFDKDTLEFKGVA